MRIGRRRPRRSEKRPSSGLTTTSTRPATRKTAPIANGAKPPSSSRSGTSTTSMPKSQAGRVLSQSPPRKLRSAKARRTALGACASGAAAGRVAAQTASAAAIAPTVLNATRMPTASATAPNMGPRMAPRTAAPNAVPSSSPRRSRGVATVSQASAPAHVVVLETPWTNRASPSAQGPSASANAKLDAASSVSPATTAIFGPRRAAASPPGIPPSSAPAPKAADEQPGAGLREPELLRVAGHERRERRRTASRRRTGPPTREREAGAPADVTDRRTAVRPIRQ